MNNKQLQNENEISLPCTSQEQFDASQCGPCMEYDDSIVRQMVECIKVYPGGKLEIIFGGGYLVEESV